MENKTLYNNLQNILCEIKNGNDRGEKITLCGANKTVDYQTVNLAAEYGLKVVAENKVQEFREKSPLLIGAEQQFIGHLQTNKVKYLIGKVSLIQSVDSIRLAEEIDRESLKKGVITNILAEINIGGELSKSGFDKFNAAEEIAKLKTLENINLVGLMAMLPKSDEENYLADLCEETRALYDEFNKNNYRFTTLSMGMSADYKIAIRHGSNMIRLGSAIFGKRNYEVEK